MSKTTRRIKHAPGRRNVTHVVGHRPGKNINLYHRSSQPITIDNARAIAQALNDIADQLEGTSHEF